MWFTSMPVLPQAMETLAAWDTIHYHALLCILSVINFSLFWLWLLHYYKDQKPCREKDDVKSSSQTEKKIVALRDEKAVERKRDFLKRVGDDYGYRDCDAGFIDSWRPRELPSLVKPVDSAIDEARNDDRNNDDAHEKEVYLDYAGAALPWKSQLEAILSEQSGQILANPHSTGPAACRTNRKIEHVKKRILDWLDAQPGRFAGVSNLDDKTNRKDRHAGYEILFTSGTTEAMKIVGERMAWQPKCPHCHRSSQFIYPAEAHTSLVGVCGLARSRGASFYCVSINELLEELASSHLSESIGLDQTLSCPHCPDRVPNLLGLPLECNFGGDRIEFSQSWAQSLSTPGRPCWSLLDIAKAASTGSISLRDLDPDFACLSFYKVFGAPTGLGCLLVKRSIINDWIGSGRSTFTSQNGYYGGGAVDLLLPKKDVTIPRSSPSPLLSLQSGSVHFRGIVELSHGLDIIQRLGGMQRIHRHAITLAREFVLRVRELRHFNKSPVVEIYGAWDDLERTKEFDVGPTVAFNLRRQDGSYVGFNEVGKLAALNRPCPIQFRIGCFCNPGACHRALELDEEQILENHKKTGHVCGDDIDIIDSRPTGAIRVSFGKDSSWEDVDALVDFISRLFVGIGSKLIESTWDNAPRRVVVKEQYIFPIKSCAAQRVPAWRLIPSTSRLIFDREFALVDASGTAMRLQKYPKMAFIEPTISLECNKMTVRAPGMPPLEIQLEQPQSIQYCEGVVNVCGNKCSGILWGDVAVSKWFSDYLDVQCWLARFSNGDYELPPGTLSENRSRSVAFANEQPLLLISKHAVDLLNEVLDSQSRSRVTSRHFRPNFVVALVGHEEKSKLVAHAEDGWRGLHLRKQNFLFDVVGQCARCSMVDVDPRSGAKGNTLRALADYRRKNGQINFGIFLKGSPSNSDSSPFLVNEGDTIWCE